MHEQKLLAKKTAYPFFVFCGFLFVFVCMAEHELKVSGNVIWSMDYTFKTIGLSLVLGGLLGGGICFLTYMLMSRSGIPDKGFNNLLSEKKCFVLSFILTITAWFPGYLAYYPGICAYDMPIQLGQVFEGYMIDHHPIAHTLLIKLFVWIGKTFLGSVNSGIGLYTFMQMAFLAFGFAYAVKTLRHFNISALWLIMIQLVVMFYPFNVYMSVSTTKDTVFTAFFLIMLSVLLRELAGGRNTLFIKTGDAALIFSAVGCILFRNNCKYAIIVLLGAMGIAFLISVKKKSCQKFFARLLIDTVVSFVVGNIVLSAIFALTDAEQGDRREMLSMPIQQFARCMLYHGGVGEYACDDGTMDEESVGLINDFLLNEGYREYVPAFADPVKRNTNTYVARYRAGDFLKTYLKLLAGYPGDFVNAALALDAGYIYPDDESHAHINEEEGKTGRGYIQTYWLEDELNGRGIYKDSKLPALYDIMESFADKNAYMDIPVIRYIFMPGAFLWLYVLLVGVLLIKRNYVMLLSGFLVFGYYATLLLGPTVQLRYIYPLMAVLPLMALVCCTIHFQPNDAD